MSTSNNTVTPGAGNEMVITPGGPRHVSRVHLVKDGVRLQQAGQQMRLVDRDDHVISRVDLDARSEQHSAQEFGEGLITTSSWTNDTGSPIMSFVTTWTVPKAPATQSGQIIFLFNGVRPTDGSSIVLPVLQWGLSAAGGGNHWAVASWFVSRGAVFHTDLVEVKEGDVLVGRIVLNNRNDPTFTYASIFANIPNTTLFVAVDSEMTQATEALEAYSITKCSDYPATTSTTMTNINLSTGRGAPVLNWEVNNFVTDCGQKTVIVVDGAFRGEVELFYRN